MKLVLMNCNNHDAIHNSHPLGTPFQKANFLLNAIKQLKKMNDRNEAIDYIHILYTNRYLLVSDYTYVMNEKNIDFIIRPAIQTLSKDIPWLLNRKENAFFVGEPRTLTASRTRF